MIFQVMIFILPSGPDGGLYGVLVDDRHIEYPLDDSVNVTFLLLKGIILKIPRVCGIVNTFKIVVCGFEAHELFLCTMKQIYRNILNTNETNGYFLQ